MPITWRNIDIGSNQAANALINAGGNTITQGISDLGGVVEDVNKNTQANWDARTKLNTENALTSLAGITDSKTLTEAMSAGGALNKGTIRDTVGAQIDLNAVTTAMTTQREKIVKRETDAKIHEDSLNQKAADRLAEADRFNKNYALAKTKADQDLKMFNLDHAKKTKELADDKLGRELTNRFLQIQINTPEVDKANQAADALKAELINKGVNPDVMNKSLGQANAIYSSGSVGTALKQTITANMEGFTAAKKQSDDLYSTVVNQFKENNRDDPTMVAALQSPDELDGVLADKLVERYTDTKDKSKVDTDQATTQLMGIRDALQEKVGDGVKITAAVVEDLIKQSGHDGRDFFKETATYTENREIVNKLADRVLAAKEWLPGGSKDSMLKMLQLRKNEADRAILTAEQNEQLHLTLESRKAATESFSGVAFTDHPGTTYDIKGQKIPAASFAKSKAEEILKAAQSELGIQFDPYGRPVTDADGKPIPFVSEKDRQAAARLSKRLDDAAKTTFKNSTGEVTTTWSNSSFFPDKAKLAAEKKAKYGE